MNEIFYCTSITSDKGYSDSKTLSIQTAALSLRERTLPGNRLGKGHYTHLYYILMCLYFYIVLCILF